MHILPTLALAFIVILIAVGLLAISWLLTGKAKICGGSCGRDPTAKKTSAKKKGSEACQNDQSSCGLCGRSPEDDSK
jgi:hypothetical protein